MAQTIVVLIRCLPWICIFFWLVWTLVWFIVDLTAINQPKLTPKYRLAINVGFIVKELRSGDTLLTSIWRRHICCATDPQVPRRSCVWCCRTTSVERFADQPPSASPLPWTVPTGAKNTFFMTVSARPSDFF